MSTEITVKKWHWWLGWSSEKIETWLEEQAAQGRHMVGADSAILRFHFVQGESKQVRYCVDYQDRVDPDYRKVFEDAGWELAYQALGWFIWRMPYEGERPEIYTDTTSLISHNQRMMTTLLIALFCQYPLLRNVFHGGFQIFGPLSVPHLLWGIYAALIGFLLYGVTRLALNIQKLKKSGL